MHKFLTTLSIVATMGWMSIIQSLHAEESPRPNIVFVLVDDLRWDALGCMGHPVAKTPNIDRIAKEGALFKNFFVSIPLCSPSRSSFLTGQYAHTTGVIDNDDHSPLSHKLVTFPKLLHDNGYETAYVGKWHMGNDASPRPGFDHWVSFKGQGVYEDPVLNIDNKIEKTTGYITDILTDHAVKFLQQKHEKPFVLYFGHKAVHGPFTPAERHKNLYTNAQFPQPPNLNDSWEGKPVMTRDLGVEGKNLKKAGNRKNPPPARVLEELARHQLQALAAVDDSVGKIFEVLEKTKQLDNTVFVFSSDNGYFWGEHRLGDKRWAYDESIRDPLLMRYPKLIKAGSTVNQFVLNIDLAPTFLELGGAPVPKNIHGRSIVPLLKNPNSEWRSSFLTEYFHEKFYPRGPTWQAIRTSDAKYIHYIGVEGMDELYDLQSDPYEMKNLINEPNSSTKLQFLKTELQKKVQETP